MEDLNDLIPAGSDLDLKVAVGINEAGQILANSGDSGTGHAYLLTPIPEPSAAILFSLFGLLLLVFPAQAVIGWNRLTLSGPARHRLPRVWFYKEPNPQRESGSQRLIVYRRFRSMVRMFFSTNRFTSAFVSLRPRAYSSM